MKKITLAIIVSYLILVSFIANAQTETKGTTQINDNNSISGELILGIPKLTDKNLFLITDALTKIKGTQFKQFCAEQRFILVKYNPKIFQSKDEIVQAIQRQNIQMPIFVKEGSFADVMEMCK